MSDIPERVREALGETAFLRSGAAPEEDYDDSAEAAAELARKIRARRYEGRAAPRGADWHS